MTQTAQPTTPLITLVLSLEQFVKSLEGSKSNLTIQAYRSDVLQFLTWITETDGTVSQVMQITRSHVEEYFATPREKGQKGTKNLNYSRQGKPRARYPS